ncbi:hypothetical protein [Risungbinella massiliensis]|uniref:hypothetical protein n=1 Tax=Risungbinella massiliensis TaxID=1329796 RepID=UPI0005CC03A9|nr:hypothetical protein [Risungbinella massiliensis]
MKQTKKRSSFLDFFRWNKSKKKNAQKNKNKLGSHDSTHSESMVYGTLCSGSGFSSGFDSCSGGFDGGGGCF